MKKIIVSLIITIALITVGINLGSFFDVTKQPKKSDIIVSLGGDNGNRIKKTLELYDDNYSLSKKMILTGVDDFDQTMKKYELDWRADYLIKHGVSKESIVFDSTAHNTFEEVLYIKHYMLSHDLKSVLIVSDPPHSRRIDFFANTVCDFSSSGLRLTIVGSENPCWNTVHYYHDKDAIIFIINESVKYTYYYLQYLLGNLHE